jgi:hypothetical protein
MKAGVCLLDRKLNVYCCRCVHRGEKLYVTKDKRQSQSWRRCICWGCGFVLLSVAILIAVLAGSEYTAVIQWVVRVGVEGWVWGAGGMVLTMTHISAVKKAFLVPQHVPQRAQGLSWNWTQASSWTGWKLIVWLLEQTVRYTNIVKGLVHKWVHAMSICVIYRVSGLKVYKNTCLCFST